MLSVLTGMLYAVFYINPLVNFIVSNYNAYRTTVPHNKEKITVVTAGGSIEKISGVF